MRHADRLYNITRRTFCTIAGVGGAGLAIVACTDNASNPTPDAHQGGGLDAPSGGACTTATDVGPATTFMLNTPVYFSSGRFFVVRDSGGLYAMTAICTHQGAVTCIGTSNNCSASGTEIYCPRHGAVFALSGAVVNGPAFTPLAHYGMCDLPNGHVGVSTMIVAASVRLAG